MNKNVFFKQFIGLPVVKTDKIVKLLVLGNIRYIVPQQICLSYCTLKKISNLATNF